MSSPTTQHLQEIDAFCLDVDSTVLTVEAIDEFAKYLGLGSEVAELTRSAMGGSMTFQDALDARLKLMKPSKEKLEKFIQDHELTLTAGVEKFVFEILESGRAVFLISGGFEEMIIPIARKLKIPEENVLANRFIFGSSGEFSDFDHECYTSRTGGKKRAVQAIKEKYKFKNLAMIGDGITDYEARSNDGKGADLFIGFGGNQEREAVKEKADHFVYSFEVLISWL